MPETARERINLKRAYEAAAKSDGHRVLVDRIWPRGVSKDDLRIEVWAKQVAPSKALRQWFHHEPTKWDAFKKRYFQELEKQPEAVESLLALVRAGRVTLVFGAKDTRRNNAVALKEYVERRARKVRTS